MELFSTIMNLPRRPDEYVTQKIVKEHVCEIYNGKRKYLELGDISAKIDWDIS